MEIKMIETDEEFLELMRASIMQEMVDRWFSLYQDGMGKFNDHKEAYDYASEQYEEMIK